MTTQEAVTFLQENYNELNCLFEQQLDLNVGGFYNPEVIWADGNEIEFKCHYDNYNNDGDSWTWYYNTKDQRFYN